MAEKGFYLFIYLLLNKAIIKSKTQAHESMTQILTMVYLWEKAMVYSVRSWSLTWLLRKRECFCLDKLKCNLGLLIWVWLNMILQTKVYKALVNSCKHLIWETASNRQIHNRAGLRKTDSAIKKKNGLRKTVCKISIHLICVHFMDFAWLTE